jgi:hypothetical protein
MKRILGYAFGPTRDGLIRLSAIISRLRAISREPIEGHLVSNQATAEREPMPGIQCYSCPANAAGIVAKLREMIERVDPSLFLVDRHPLGVENELPPIIGEFPCARALIAGAGAQPKAPPANSPPVELMARAMYDLTISPADQIPFHEYGRSLQVEPLVSREPAEFVPQVDARTYLRQTVKPLFVFHEEAGIRLYERLRADCQTCGGLRIEWRLATQDKSNEARFPKECVYDLSLLAMHQGVAAVIAPPLYSFFHEALSSGVPALFVPLGGKMAEENARGGPLLATDAKSLFKRIQAGEMPDPRAPIRMRGAAQAADFLRQHLGQRQPRPVGVGW